MRYEVRMLDLASNVVRSATLDARTASDAATAALGPGQALLSVVAQAGSAPAMGLAVRRGFDVAWWCRELRTLVGAGMTVVEALETLQAQPSNATRAALHGQILSDLQAGKPLSSALAATNAFPAVLIASVRASERTSALPQALDDFLAYQAVLDGLRKQVVSAALYPALVVLFGSIVSALLLLFVLPRFADMYADLHGSVSTATSIVLAVSQLVLQHRAVVAAALLSVIAACVIGWRSGRLQAAAGWCGEHIGWLQAPIREFRLAKLYQSLALMFGGGYPLDEALRQCAALDLGQQVTQGVALAQAALARGQRVSDAFDAAGLSDEVSRRLLRVGERTGGFERVLQTIAQRHSMRFTTFVERATRLVEPILLLLVALFVGGIVVLMYMPVFDMASSLQ